jgi:hypothetical protein
VMNLTPNRIDYNAPQPCTVIHLLVDDTLSSDKKGSSGGAKPGARGRQLAPRFPAVL